MSPAASLPLRVRGINAAPLRPERTYVLYWMTAFRRLHYNFALQTAVERAVELGRPLVILEALRCDYPWASRRHHAFVVDGMIEHRRRLSATPVRYYPFVELEPGDSKGLLRALAADACIVVGDDCPGFFLPAMLQAAGPMLDVRLEAVDSNGLLPLAGTGRVFHRAFDFRRYLQRELPTQLRQFPEKDPLSRLPVTHPPEISGEVQLRWPVFEAGREVLTDLPVACQAEPVGRGGTAAALDRMKAFFANGLAGYNDSRRPPDSGRTSGLSPYLHFGQISSHQVFAELMETEGWAPSLLQESARGQRQGWWGVRAPAESFLDQLITWRELGFNMARHSLEYDRYDSLPRWAIKTLFDHREDSRDPCYSLAQFEGADTHDALWNAAQRQLVRTGGIDSYVRMLWGKKILHWSESPEAALEIMLELNNRWALDGRDPNSVSGIFWTLGRYDRAWGPERPIFGKVRYMSSANTARKMPVKEYLHKYRE